MKHTFSIWSARSSVLAAVLAASGVIACGGSNEPDDPTAGDQTPSADDIDIHALTEQVGPGSKGPGVYAVYRHLRQYGYLPNADLEKVYPHWAPIVDRKVADPSSYDDDIEQAVKQYQQFMGLEVTGVVDVATLTMMNTPRCAHPENEYARLDDSEKFFLNANTWTTNNILYKTTAGTADITDETFKMGQASTELNNNSRVNLNGTSGATFDIEVRFFNKGSPPAGWSDFSSSSVLAYASKTRIAFNDSHNWNYVSGNTSTFDVRTVFTHEVLHSIGLGHSSSSSAIMRPALPGGAVQHSLARDDQTGLKLRWLDTPTEFTGANLRDIAQGGVGVTGTYGVTSTNQLVRHDGSNNWTVIAGHQASSVAVDKFGKPWITKPDNSIWFLDTSNVWNNLWGVAKDIAVNDNDQMWAVGTDVDGSGNSTIYKWNASILNWEASDVRAKTLAIDSTDKVWVVQGNGTIRRRTTASGVTGSWQTVPGSGCAKDIATGDQNDIWIVSCTVVSGTNNSVMTWNEQPAIGTQPAVAKWETQPLMSGTKLAVNFAGRPLVVRSTGNLQYGW